MVGTVRRFVLVFVAMCVLPAAASAATALTEKPGQRGTVAPRPYGGLDCNGLSPIQHPARTDLACADVHNAWSDDGRFWDNGRYIGHDEPDLNFDSRQAGSGNDVSWTFTLGRDPTQAPTDVTPGADVSHYFELTPAIWFSMNMCDPQSYPLLPCTPNSDKNAPNGQYPGGGSAFMELQFYPPGFGPWVDAPSFDNKHWGAALTIDSLEGTYGFTNLNPNCTEPINFSFIQLNGVPPGPPSPQLADLQSNEPNANTLLMNPGDTIHVHMYDAPAPGGGDALIAVVDDLTTGERGFMQASAANGFMNTSIVDCSGTPFNFEPEYSSAAPQNLSPWGAGTEVISAAIETGHWEPCTSLSGAKTVTLFAGVTDQYYTTCSGPYEDSAPGGDGGTQPEVSDAYCFPAGDTHGGLAKNFPDTMTGCEANFFQNGDLDFDGSPYWTEWPTGPTAGRTPGSITFSPPTFGPSNRRFAQYQFQTDVAFSEQTTCGPSTPSGCTTPPPGAPGQFYPFWTLQSGTHGCIWEFGDVTSGGKDFGGPAQYGKLNPKNFPDLSSPFKPNPCL
jgi:hypothetical protein